jgi:hypothetical protein
MSDVLNPLLRKWIETLIRDGLKALGLWLVANNVIEGDAWTAALPGLTVFLVGLAWSLYERVRALRKVNTALAMPAGSTPQQLSDTIHAEGAVPASLPLTATPHLQSHLQSSPLSSEKP